MDSEKPQNYWQQDDQPDTEATQVDAPDEQADPTLSKVASVSTESAATNAMDDTAVNWTAQEYIHADKNALWFVIFTVVVLGLIAIDVFLLQSWTFSALVIVMAIAVIVYSRRPPRDIHYSLSSRQGLHVGEKLHQFSEFKAFGLIEDGQHHSIMLIPTKRFAPGVSVYFPDEVGERVVDILGQHLPMENLKLDVIDILVRKLRL